MDNHGKKVAIIGAGLVGSLQASYLAKRGYKVDVYELRPDIRKQEVVQGRSVNLTLTERGRKALAGVGLDDEVINLGVPLQGRIIHDVGGVLRKVTFQEEDQRIWSLNRRILNGVLLSAAERNPKVTTHFEHKLLQCDLDTGRCEFQSASSGENVTATYDLVIGCDGAHSALRRQIMRQTRIDYSQRYLTVGYIELRIPNVDGKFAVDERFLHIWSRDENIMVALAEAQDKSFVITLLMPFERFASLKTEEQVLSFFEEHFSDAIPLIGKEALVQTYMKSQPQPIVAVKCNPFHAGDKVVIMGDAAHAIVPFFGQGMNCGVEDCTVFNELMDQYNDDFSRVISKFSERRIPDCHAVCDLAMENLEMRARGATFSAMARRVADVLLNKLLPNSWIPLYTMVFFTQKSYSTCVAERDWQDKMLNRAMKACGVAAAAVSVALSYYFIGFTMSNDTCGNH